MQNTQLRTSERSARLREQQESIERLEAKIRDEIRQQEELEQQQNANDQMVLQQRIREENMHQARLQLQQQQQQQQQQHFAAQPHLLSLQSLSDGMNQQLRTASLPAGALSDLLQSRNLHPPVGNLNSFLAQPTGAAASVAQFPNFLRTQQLLLQQQQQQQQQQFQQQRLSLSGLDSFAERQRLQNELLMLSMNNMTGGVGSSAAAASLLQPQLQQQQLLQQQQQKLLQQQLQQQQQQQQQALLLQQQQQQHQHHQQHGINNGPGDNSNGHAQVEDDAPLSPGALDQFWDGP
jgi:hypothetical protein